MAKNNRVKPKCEIIDLFKVHVTLAISSIVARRKVATATRTVERSLSINAGGVTTTNLWFQ